MVSLSNDFPKKFQLLLNASENKFQHSKVLISHIYQELENIHFYLVAHTKKMFQVQGLHSIVCWTIDRPVSPVRKETFPLCRDMHLSKKEPHYTI